MNISQIIITERGTEKKFGIVEHNGQKRELITRRMIPFHEHGIVACLYKFGCSCISIMRLKDCFVIMFNGVEYTVSAVRKTILHENGIKSTTFYM